MGSSTKTTDTTPWAPAQPYILSGLKSTQDVFDQNQAGLQDTSAQLKQGFNALAPTAFGANPLQDQTESALSDTIGGKYLAANPYLTGIMNTTNANITNDVNGQFETGGRYGSANHAGILAQKIGDADNSLQYQNYNDERARQQAAIGMSAGVQAGRYAGVSPLLALAQGASSIPYTGVDALNSNVKTASGGYNTQTATTTADPFTTILGAATTLGGAALSDARLKDVSSIAGVTPDGLPLVNYTLSADPTNTPQTGVIAQDVAQVRPDALGPTGPGGMMSVDYGKLGLPDPTTLASQFHPDAQAQQFPFTPSFDPSAQTPPAPPAALPPPAPAGGFNATGNPDDTITPMALPKIKGPSFMDGLLSPDRTTLGGRLTMLGASMLAGADGSPLQGVGKGLLGLQKDDADAAKQATEDAYKKAEIATATRNANKPTIQMVGPDAWSIPANGGPPTLLVHGAPKTAELPAGVYLDAKGVPQALPGFENNLPDVKAKRESDDASDKSDAAEKRQAALFAHQDQLEGQRESAAAARTDKTIAAVTSRQQAAANAFSAGSIDDLAATTIRTGSYPPGISRSPAVMARVSNAVHQKLQDMGLTGSALADAQAAFTGEKAGARTVGTIGGKVDYASNELTQSAPLALASSAALPRGKFVPFNQVSQLIQAGNSDPALADFQVKTQSVLNAYNVLSARGGSSAAERAHNMTLLSTASSPQAYAAQLSAMMQEAGVARSASRTTMGAITNGGAPVPANNNTPPVRIMGNADYGRLASGTRYTGPDGQVRVKR